MNRFNHEITDMLLEKFKGLSIEHTEGRFLADKSYAFDTIFFAARFIARFRFGKKFRKLDLREKSSQYFQDLYCLRQATQIPNYMTEAVALFRFTGILKRIDQNLYEITDEDLLDFTSSSFENAYIFLYMLVTAFSKMTEFGNCISNSAKPTTRRSNSNTMTKFAGSSLLTTRVFAMPTNYGLCSFPNIPWWSSTMPTAKT